MQVTELMKIFQVKWSYKNTNTFVASSLIYKLSVCYSFLGTNFEA